MVHGLGFWDTKASFLAPPHGGAKTDALVYLCYTIVQYCYTVLYTLAGYTDFVYFVCAILVTKPRLLLMCLLLSVFVIMSAVSLMYELLPAQCRLEKQKQCSSYKVFINSTYL